MRTRHLLARSALAVAIATGFASASFSGPQALAASPPAANAPLKLKSLVITGNKLVSTDEILAALPFHQGDTVTRDQIAAGAQDVMGVYQKKNVGLKFGQKMKFVGAAVYVEWMIEEQAPEVVQTALVVDKIVFEGNKKLSAADLTNATKLRPGSTIDQAAMAADQAAVQKAYQAHDISAAIQVVPSQAPGSNHVVLTYQISEK
ncbi:MAG: POTRA domain-containing protein [Gluconacetobacter sp.]